MVLKEQKMSGHLVDARRKSVVFYVTTFAVMLLTHKMKAYGNEGGNENK